MSRVVAFLSGLSLGIAYYHFTIHKMPLMWMFIVVALIGIGVSYINNGTVEIIGEGMTKTKEYFAGYEEGRRSAQKK